MSKETLIENIETVKEIIERLNHEGIYLYDMNDHSIIIMDDDLKSVIKRYYDYKLNA